MTQGVTWFHAEEDSALLELLRRWTVAYSRSLQVCWVSSVNFAPVMRAEPQPAAPAQSCQYVACSDGARASDAKKSLMYDLATVS